MSFFRVRYILSPMQTYTYEEKKHQLSFSGELFFFSRPLTFPQYPDIKILLFNAPLPFVVLRKSWVKKFSTTTKKATMHNIPIYIACMCWGSQIQCCVRCGRHNNWMFRSWSMPWVEHCSLIKNFSNNIRTFMALESFVFIILTLCCLCLM